MAKSRHVVIGTAGHVDHGKTSLVLALTGIDADRLAEEKRRGITIENGFAHFDLGDGERASIIDVPGHERFVRHMLAGSGAVDLALLVVAADDGIMPQTIEHFHILRLLGVKRAVVALTKCDLAPDNEWLDLIEDSLKSLLNDAFTPPTPIVRVSALTGQGLDTLAATLREAALSSTAKLIQGRFRLPVDRIFTMTGFGTVVTGSLLEGTVAAGGPAAVYPSGLEAKIRQVQVHSQTVPAAYPGQRTALNISNLAKDDLKRGDVLATPGSLTPSMMLDVTLALLPESFFSTATQVKSGRLVKLHLAAREITAKLVLIDKDYLAPGQKAYAQLRLTEPVVARKGDRFVIRRPSPALTLGGGEVLDAAPLKRRRKPEVAELFRAKETGDHIQRVELAVREKPGSFEIFTETMLRADLEPVRARSDANVLVDKGKLFFLGSDVYIHAKEMESLSEKLFSLLDQRHKANPYSPGVSMEELRSKLLPNAPAPAADGFFAHLTAKKSIVREGGFVRLRSFEPKVDEVSNLHVALLEKAYLDFGFSPLANSFVLPEDDPIKARARRTAYESLVRKGVLKPLDDLYHVHKSHFERAFEVFKDLAAGGPVLIGPFRDALKTSRKVALALLDSFDRAGLSHKSGDGRLPR
ncbi:MAG: selenocysteine-specific translation elongation factor [Deltaproteobacteria bacterium]|jgi:selenocysteine-specific elongation factor|nr:selenocysteine-specific translation elongation factor [Deltaproteobacteria bacterium]